MLPQKTSPEVVEQERRLVQQLTGAEGAEHVRFNDGGWTSRVYIVGDGRCVVKFPRGEEVRREYAAETSMLRLLEQLDSPVQTPKLRWSHPENAYLGYDGIVGDEFAPLAAHMDPEARRAIGRMLGGFLKQLHAQTLPGAPIMTLQDEIDEFQEKYRLSSSVVRRDFSTGEQAKLAALIEEQLPRDLILLGEDRALCHGDLGLWNMVLKPDGAIGVIDFGDAGYFDRSKDFMGLRDTELLEGALETYGESGALRQKIAIRQTILYVLDLPFFIGKEDDAGLGKTVAKIKHALELR